MRGYKNFEGTPHPGDLCHLVEIGYTENAINANGYPEPKDVVLCRVWASAVDAGNQHYRAADVMNTEQVINFTIRYRRDVKPGMWVKFQDEKWIISTLGEYSFKRTYPDPELSFKTKMADLPLIIQEMIFANKIDDNGVLIRSSTDKPPYFAVGFKSEKANHKYRFVWLYKVRAKPVTENYATKEGKSITRQTGEVEWTAIRRTHDNQYQAVADEDENGFTAAKGATFLQSVYEPVFTTGG